MEPHPQKTQKQNYDILALIDSLPQPVYQLCQSGQSVKELSHLAKNMIQMVGGSAEIIGMGLEQKNYDRLERSWRIFEPNLARLKKFVLDLVKYTKHYPLQKSTCDLNQLVQKGIESCNCLLKNKSVEINFSESKLPKLSLDPDRIAETIGNLITHAVDNMPQRTGTVTIQTKLLSEHKQVQLTVCDDGLALNETTIRRLSIPQERTSDMCGTGFDIPLAKLYIEQHNGYMELDSIDEGNRVRVYLPIEE